MYIVLMFCLVCVLFCFFILIKHNQIRALLSLRIDSEPAVRSNSAWALGRLYPDLVEPRQQVLVESLLQAMLNDTESSVRDEARLALEQLEQPEVLERLQTLVDEGLLA